MKGSILKIHERKSPATTAYFFKVFFESRENWENISYEELSEMWEGFRAVLFETKEKYCDSFEKIRDQAMKVFEYRKSDIEEFLKMKRNSQ